MSEENSTALTLLRRFYDATYGKTELIPALDFEQARKVLLLVSHA